MLTITSVLRLSPPFSPGSGGVVVSGPFRSVAAQSFQAGAVTSAVQLFQPRSASPVQRFQPGAQSVQGIQ